MDTHPDFAESTELHTLRGMHCKIVDCSNRRRRSEAKPTSHKGHTKVFALYNYSGLLISLLLYTLKLAANLHRSYCKLLLLSVSNTNTSKYFLQLYNVPRNFHKIYQWRFRRYSVYHIGISFKYFHSVIRNRVPEVKKSDDNTRQQ
jgi:hypothetical protein